MVLRELACQEETTGGGEKVLTSPPGPPPQPQTFSPLTSCLAPVSVNEGVGGDGFQDLKVFQLWTLFWD